MFHLAITLPASLHGRDQRRQGRPRRPRADLHVAVGGFLFYLSFFHPFFLKRKFCLIWAVSEFGMFDKFTKLGCEIY